MQKYQYQYRSKYYKGQSSFARLFLDFAIGVVLALGFIWLICQWGGYEFSDVLRIVWTSATSIFN